MPPLAQSAGGDPTRSRSPLKFFVLVLGLSLPIWAIGAATRLQLLPALPVSALMAVCPALAASMLVFRESRTAGVIGLLKRSFDYERIQSRIWYAPAVLLMPGVTVLAYGLLRWMGSPLPAPQLPLVAAPVMFVAFFVGALGEELGWSGYAIDPMQERSSALQAAMLLGLVWAAWHVVPLLQAHRPPAWIAWWGLYTVAGRVLLTWLYNNTGKSVFAAALYHAMGNVSWQLFPSSGSHWDPRLAGLLTALAAAIVTLVWGPRTLARFGRA